MTTTTNSNRPTHRLFAVTKSGKSKYWQPVGALFAHHDGKGFNLSLDYGAGAARPRGGAFTRSCRRRTSLAYKPARKACGMDLAYMPFNRACRCPFFNAGLGTPP